MRPDHAPPAADRGCLIVVGGLPGSGRTTRARELTQERGGVRLAPDEWLEATGGSLGDADARARIESLQWEMAKGLLEAGATVVLEWGVWRRIERDRLREAARALGAAVELCFLEVGTDEPDRRVAGFEAPTAEELRLFDATS